MPEDRTAIRAAVRAAKEIGVCSDCGQSFPPTSLDFDHVPERGPKRANISVLASVGTMEEVLAELAKCELVCANCHRIRTAERTEARQMYEHATREARRALSALQEEHRGRVRSTWPIFDPLGYGEAQIVWLMPPAAPTRLQRRLAALAGLDDPYAAALVDVPLPPLAREYMRTLTAAMDAGLPWDGRAEYAALNSGIADPVED